MSMTRREILKGFLGVMASPMLAKLPLPEIAAPIVKPIVKRGLWAASALSDASLSREMFKVFCYNQRKPVQRLEYVVVPPEFYDEVKSLIGPSSAPG